VISYLLSRPIAVLLSFTVAILLGFYFLTKVPISLLPSIDIPKISITITYGDHTADQLEELAARPIREHLLTMSGLREIESKAANHQAWIYLQFEHGTRMDLAYVEVNEKLDHIISSLPKDMTRPVVTRINTSDIPIVRLHVYPSAEGPDLAELSKVAERVLKKRIEQIPGVSLVDMNGQVSDIIKVVPDLHALRMYDLQPADLHRAISTANAELGSLSIRDGQYRYFVKLANTIGKAEEISRVPVPVPQGFIPLDRLAQVVTEPSTPLGFHLFDTKQGIVFTIQKQATARMTELMPRVDSAIVYMQRDFPDLDFSTTRNQRYLLDAGIDNLRQDIIYGGLVTVLLLFMFLGHWSAPLLMSISIPISLIISIVFFYLWDISFNIISLSGIALGIGMLIDNSIVVIDHISRKRRIGHTLSDSAIHGTNEMVAPVLSQVLTTVAVYAPLVLWQGLAGDLLYDQAKALTISLGVSLLVAFILAPLLYPYFLGRLAQGTIKEDTLFYRWIERGYHQMIGHILRYRLLYLMITLAMMPLGIWLATRLPIRSLPELDNPESLVHIDWNEEIDAIENKRRCMTVLQAIQPSILHSSSDIGVKEYVMQEEKSTIQAAEIHFACPDSETRKNTDSKLKDILRNQYPKAFFSIEPAPNAFTQLFSNNKPYFEARFLYTDQNRLATALHEFVRSDTAPTAGESMTMHKYLTIIPDYQRMALYGVSRQSLDEVLERTMGHLVITDLKNGGYTTQVLLQDRKQDLQKIMQNKIRNTAGIDYPLTEFISISYAEQEKYILADRGGRYHSIQWENPPNESIVKLEKKLVMLAHQQGSPVRFTGRYFEDRDQLRQMMIIFGLVALLMYFILAIQYESLWQPLLVMLTIPLGITGSVVVMYSLDLPMDTMAAVGFIVILGLIVDDPILKIETLNRLRKQYIAEGKTPDSDLMHRMIHEAGSICLKPLLMVSLTTTLALIPVLFIPGIGNDLQRPMVWVIIGGLSIGTFFTTWFIPIAYWYVMKWKAQDAT
jgi:multidrug efflux pump subunit AcrB